jgi:hypothetical protein
MVFLGSGDQYFNGNTGVRHLPNVLIYHTGGSGVVLSGTARQMGQKLLIRSGFLDSAYTTFPAATWVFGDTTTPSGFSSGFYNNSGELILYNGAGLRTNDLYTSNPGGNLTLNGSAGAGCVVRASGNVTVNKSFGVTGGAVLDDFTLVMNGTGTGPGVAAPYTVDGKELAAGSGAVVIGSLRVDSTGSQAHIIFASDITINGNVTIDDTGGTGAFLYGGEDRTSANSYHVKVLGNWTQYYDTNVMPTPDYTDDPFVPQMGTVEFARGDSARKVEIKGNTHWYNLECHEKGMTLQFGYYQSAHNNYHRITKGLNIDPSSPALTDRIFLTRTDPSAEPSHDSAKPTPTVGVNPAEYWVPPLNPTVDFWVFDLGIDPVSGESAEIELNNVEISYSYSIRRIPVPPVEGGSSRIVLAWPYIFAWQDASGNPVYADGTLVPLTLPSGASTADDLWRTPFSLYNKNWFVANNFFYSFTEDTNHNGKIDRIRLQSSFELVDTYFQNPSNGHYAFQEFDMIVDGYEIDRTRPGSYNGFARAGSTADKIDSIYVYLKERPYTDGGAVLNWRIVHNTSLLDLTTHQMLIGNAGDTGSTTDTVPPRISYAQVLPENPQIYFRMSENVDASPSTGLALDALSGPSTPRTGMVSAVNNTEFVIGTSRAYNVNELAGGKELFKIKQIRDLASQVIDIHHDPKRVYNYQYPSPRYPVDYNYQAYIIIEKENTINPKNPITEVRLPPHSLELLDSDLALPPLSLPPGSLLSHRVSDILISVPPVHGGDNRYFIWPVYARYTNPANPLIPRDVLWGQEDTDTGLIWDFSGRKFLEERNTTIQVRLNSALSGAWKAASVPFSVNMRYGVNVPNGYRYPPENNTKLQGSGGLWLPPVPPPPPNYPASYINLVPAFFDFAAFKAPVSVNNDAYSFEINKDEPGYDSVARVDFVFQIKEPSGNVNIPDDMYAARLDIKPGSPIPPDWYHKVRPFTYDIHNIRLQRGGVTILNNVINPTKGEKTYIRYHLMNGGRVTVQVFTMDGSLVKVIRREHREAGEWVDVWEGRNKGERAVARGMYFVRVVGPGIDEIRKVMVVK